MSLYQAGKEPDTCTDGIEKIDGECIGVNADGYDFETAEISDVAKAIAAENKRIEKQPHVTVAMMLPLQSDKPSVRRQIRSDLQGAYLGQRRANEGEGEPPKIRLALANPGRDYGRQKDVVDTLLEWADSKQHKLRAVTGFNLSLDTTEAAVKRLTKHRVPVLASRISGDRISNKETTNGTDKLKFPGLARIIPTNGDAAKALADYNGERGLRNQKTVLVYDSREDSYVQSLADAFTSIKEKGPAGQAAIPFESPAIDEAGTTGNQFASIAHNICGSSADTVYFAGRTLHLRIFALKLAAMQCEKRHYTIISGSDAASLRQNMSEDDWGDLRGAGGKPKVTVQYAAPAHPGAWKAELAERTDKPQYLKEPDEALGRLEDEIDAVHDENINLGSVPDLKDSRTMLVYDGLITIGTALHQAQQGGTEDLPSRRDVGAQWALLNSQSRVQGSSGLICLTSSGNPYDKPAAIVELDPGTEGKGELKFVGLGWPTGRPQLPNCVIPSSS
ncbi:amino acid ABC transporter substrate-binding protein [Streptomyces sp. A7024]|uniref:Amino acid ABC transporter substrate-binding protein n=1 Tax=Streptomyces coryli TaxID=1128680 RepID=A0A6G4U101_9ACTN|nr:amino acid ABC transporter substrate-binding protein [Streptomyces coryli]